MSTSKSYQDLEVWRKSIDLAEMVYRVSVNFPPEERFGVTGQMRRAAVSVAANIAEGAERHGKREFLQFPGDSQRLPSGNGDVSDSGAAAEHGQRGAGGTAAGPGVGNWSNAQRTQTLAAVQSLTPADFPLSLTTGHLTQVIVHGVDVFHPNTGEVRSDGPDGIACWFIDTDYNEEAFFVRHAYFLGASDPYKSLKTTLKAEIDADAWATLHSDTSRPFDKPDSGRIAVKVINHLGDEVLKVFRVD